MKSQVRQFSFIVVTLLFTCSALWAFGQRKTNVTPELSRKNPDKWFSILIPTSMTKLTGLADVDGGFYEAPGIRISFSYWTHKNTPNYVINSRTAFPQKLVFVCEKSKETRVFRTKIRSKKAVVQRCPETGASNFRYLYHVNFPTIKVFDGESFGEGTFTLAVNYSNKRYLGLASQIAHSIKFRSKLPKN